MRLRPVNRIRKYFSPKEEHRYNAILPLIWLNKVGDLYIRLGSWRILVIERYRNQLGILWGSSGKRRVRLEGILRHVIAKKAKIILC